MVENGALKEGKWCGGSQLLVVFTKRLETFLRGMIYGCKELCLGDVEQQL